MRPYQVFVVAGCMTASGCGPTLKDAATEMNSPTAKFQSGECVAARHGAIDFSEKEPGTALLAIGASAIPLAGLSVSAALNSYEYNKRNETVANLINACGEDSLVPFMKDVAAKGNPQAQTWLAQAYDEGLGVQRDPAQAVHWYDLAATQGDSDAEINLGAHYAAGTGVVKDDSRAVALWQAAAAQRRPEAYTNLGAFYLSGRGVAQDSKEAEQYFRKAAIQGHGSAQFMLGQMYQEGVGVQHSDLIAYRWYRLAGKNGEKRADEKLAAVAADMSKDDKDIGDQQAKHCLDTLYKECP